MTRRIAGVLVAGVSLALVVLLAGPPPLGGHLTMSIVHGSSMRPTYATGDLVLSARHPTYDIGDVVVYGTERGDVIHRIVDGGATDGFVTQGDNRVAVDEWTPTAAEVSGVPFLRVPRAGALLVRLQDALGPHGLVLLALLALGAALRPRRAVARGARPRWPSGVREVALAGAALAVGGSSLTIALLRSAAIPDIAVRGAVAATVLGAVVLMAAVATGQLLHVRLQTWTTDLVLGRRVLTVDAVDHAGRTVAQVSSARALRRAADRNGRPVLRRTTDALTTAYEVVDGDVVVTLTRGHAAARLGRPSPHGPHGPTSSPVAIVAGPHDRHRDRGRPKHTRST